MAANKSGNIPQRRSQICYIITGFTFCLLKTALSETSGQEAPEDAEDAGSAGQAQPPARRQQPNVGHTNKTKSCWAEGLCGGTLSIEKSKQLNFGVALLCCSHREEGRWFKGI